MTVNLKPITAYPFGSNIHFAYRISSAELLFLHPDFDWIFSAEDGQTFADALISKLHDEELPELGLAYNAAVKGKFSGSLKLNLSTASGERWLQICPFLGELESDPVLLGSVSDITAEIENNEIIARYTNKKNSILHMLAHDLRGPLNIAKSVITIVDKEIENPGLRQKTHYIAGILQQAIDLIADLVTREFLETTEVVLVKKRVDIVNKLREYLEECKRSSDLAQRTFLLTSSSKEIFIELDDAKFMQIVNNLISNALKFTTPGGIISVQVTELEDQVSFSFADDGIGIPKAQLGEIFEKFTAARRPGLNGEPTLGLGLSIVETIVSWHGGKIWCESEEGLGSTFHFLLPKS